MQWLPPSCLKMLDLEVEARIEDTSLLVLEDCNDEDDHGDLIQKVDSDTFICLPSLSTCEKLHHFHFEV